MKQKVLAIAGCIAATAPSVSIADVLPEKFVGLNLGEISSSSFLNQPFKGVIPFLFTSYENSKNLSINIAPQSVFNKIGAEKHSILNNLNFQVVQQNNKPVILISSDEPINLPFLNFILEIKGPNTLVYQDYTVLLDPASKQQSVASNSDYIQVNNTIEASSLYKKYKKTVNSKTASKEKSLKESGTLLLANLSSETSSNSQSRKYTVKRGDSLSKIAKRQNFKNASLKIVSKLIYQKNPKAFIRGNVNRLKKGAILNLPTASEVNGFEIAKNKPDKPKPSTVTKPSPKPEGSIAETKTEKPKTKTNTTYKVLKGDSLSKITKKFASKDVSFNKLMNSIYRNNPTAFINKSKNRIKAGATLEIPTFSDLIVDSKQVITKKEDLNTQISDTKDIKPKFNDVISVNKAKRVKAEEKTVKKDDVVKIELKPNQYQVSEGDTLTSVTNKLGYKEVPFAQMLKGIYDNNPDAFEEGKMTSLTTGAIITLPALDSIALKPKPKPKITEQLASKTITKVQEVKKPDPNAAITKPENQVVKTDLTKRIRELRKELRQAKESLSELKSNLSNKEILLQQKNIQLESLNTMLTKYDKAIDSETLAAVAIKTKTDQALLESKIEYKPKSKAEMAKLKRDLLNRSKKTEMQLAKLEELKNKTSGINTQLSSVKSESNFKNYHFSSILDSSNTKYAYLIVALLLGLLLIRYRRALYSYTYSKINPNQPKYYPVPDVDKYDLQEKNINFHDPKMDEDPSNYDLITQDPAVQTQESSVSISPHLIEATEEIFDNEENKQIAHCEHLVTELFDDLDNRDDLEKQSEWNDIEKFCDNYIEKIKDKDSKSSKNTIIDTDSALVEEATDFNDMMTDLLESLEKVDKSMKKNSKLNEEFPDITEDKHPLV